MNGRDKRLLGACVLLSFIPLTFIPLMFGYAPNHDISMRVAQNSTQILLIILSLVILRSKRAIFDSDAWMAVAVAVCLGASQILAVWRNPSDEKNYVMPAVFPLFLLAGPVVFSLARTINVEAMGNFVAKIARFLLWFFCLECATRYAFSAFVGTRLDVEAFQTQQLGADWFYAYKFSVFYADANSVGLALLCLIAVLLVFRQYVSRWHLVLAYGLVLATVSRASIVAAICQLIIYKCWRWRKWFFLALAIGLPVIVILLLTFYSTEGPSSFTDFDGSFASKFLILQKMVEAWPDASTLQKLVGIGAGNTEGLIGIAAHSLIAGFGIELGLVGSALVIAYVWLLSRRSSKAFYLLTIPIIINGMSLVLTSMPYFYVTLGLSSAVVGDQMENLVREKSPRGLFKGAVQPVE